MPRCFLGLGGNVGNVAATFASALDDLRRIDERIHVVRTSSIYRTAAIGENAGGEFLNAVAEIETVLMPLELLARLQSIESAFGRTHDVHWGPRPLDIDLLLYDEAIIEEPGLVVPHPALWYRRFVLDPLTEIAAAVLHPLRRATIHQVRQTMLIRPFRLRLACEDVTRRDHLLAELRRRFPDVQFEVASAQLPSGKSLSGMCAAINPLENISVRRAGCGGGNLNIGLVTVPADDDGGVSFLSSVIASATDRPVIVAGPMLA